MLIICSCGNDGGNTQQVKTPEKLAEVEAPPKAVEASLATETVSEPVVAMEEQPAEETTESNKKKPRAKMVFDKPTHDYGFIMQGDKVKHDFHFKNIGDDDLLIKRVKPSSGCTISDYPKDVIPPGGSGKVSVVFNSSGKQGRQNPTVDVITNYQRRLTMTLQGSVNSNSAKIVFDQPTFDYGFIMQGDKVNHDFYFKNAGNDDLFIKRVTASCGCTTPDYPKEAIPPGASGKISVVFNSSGKLGRQNPTVDVFTNNQGKLTLKLKGFVDAERAKTPSALIKKVEEVVEEKTKVKSVVNEKAKAKAKIEEIIDEKAKVEVDTTTGGM